MLVSILTIATLAYMAVLVVAAVVHVARSRKRVRRSIKPYTLKPFDRESRWPR